MTKSLKVEKQDNVLSCWWGMRRRKRATRYCKGQSHCIRLRVEDSEADMTLDARPQLPGRNVAFLEMILLLWKRAQWRSGTLAIFQNTWTRHRIAPWTPWRVLKPLTYSSGTKIHPHDLFALVRPLSKIYTSCIGLFREISQRRRNW